MTHTKGPWTFRDCTPDVTDGKYTGLRYEIWASTLDYHIANTTDGAKQAEANARLIAAAPEMLEFIRDLVNEPERMTDDDLREKTLFEAKEIIASATGLK